MITVTVSNSAFFDEDMQVTISGLSGRPLPSWVCRWPFQDGDKLLVAWFCRKFLGWTISFNGIYKIKRVVNRTAIQIV